MTRRSRGGSVATQKLSQPIFGFLATFFTRPGQTNQSIYKNRTKLFDVSELSFQIRFFVFAANVAR